MGPPFPLPEAFMNMAPFLTIAEFKAILPIYGDYRDGKLDRDKALDLIREVLPIDRNELAETIVYKAMDIQYH